MVLGVEVSTRAEVVDVFGASAFQGSVVVFEELVTPRGDRELHERVHNVYVNPEP